MWKLSVLTASTDYDSNLSVLVCLF